MFGLGTIINTVAIIAGGLLGLLLGKNIKDNIRDAMITACGVSTLFIAISGALEGLLSAEGSTIHSARGMYIVVIIVLGTLIGEIIGIEEAFEKFGAWLKIKTGNSKDAGFIDSFLTATFTVCIGAMAVVGSIKDGIYGDYSILVSKSILDFIIIMVMVASLGKGAIFSFIPVFVLQGLVTVLARIVEPILNEEALGNLSMIGSILIFCVGVNLVWNKKIRVANMLPAIILAVVSAFLPWKF